MNPHYVATRFGAAVSCNTRCDAGLNGPLCPACWIRLHHPAYALSLAKGGPDCVWCGLPLMAPIHEPFWERVS